MNNLILEIKYIAIPYSRLLLLLLITVFLSSSLFAQTNNTEYEQLSFSNNYRIHPSQVTQTEVFITRNPINEDVLFSSCNTLTFIPFFISEGVYVSSNGGDSWRGSDSCTGNPVEFHGGDPGIAIDINGRFVITRLGRSPFLGLFSHFSYDEGMSWTPQTAISNDDLERASIISDASVESSYYGRTYACWVKFAPPYPVMFSYVDSDTETWSTSAQINNPPNRCAGGDNAVSLEGTIVTCWAGVTETSPFKETHVGVALSNNGGTNWNVIENAFEVNGITGLLPDKGNIRVNGLPGIDIDKSEGERNGWVYIVTGQKELAPAGSDPDIILNRSTDGGITWSSGIRVNQDALNNGKIQYFPTVHVDANGGLNIIFYDDRNTTSDSTGVFLARSIDGGDTWSEYEISDHNFKPNAIGGLGQGYQGDNIDITSTSTKLWPVWMDNSTGNYQIWTSPISFSDLDYIGEDSYSPFFLEQNFPNPFHTETAIVFDVLYDSYVEISIVDIIGNELIISNERKSPGHYELKISKDELALKSGIYLIKMKSDNSIQTRKILLIN